MIVYVLTEPVDDFTALTPLPDWISADPVPHTHWALQAILALADAADYVHWDGDMRHLPSGGAVIAPPDTHPYLVIKRDNNGTTFVVSDAEIPGLTDTVERSTRTERRPIGTWTHPTSRDIPTLLQPTHPNLAAGPAPPF
ncbi:hypothetical protein GCM10010532_092570 [Dactylosporangium siamense]|uniref:Uncharacterized protein n=2 Tax=Dactylosporangium siamense TaxID=685454 RepID=A0A919UCH6_9ACTN|nr:hypothetical protein Dsi01nite_084380 [Dactylosporangium siamense]